MTMPNTTWWMCNPPGATLPGHHDTWARIIRTLTRMNRKATRKAQRKQNSGSRPVVTIVSVNQAPMCSAYSRSGPESREHGRRLRARALPAPAAAPVGSPAAGDPAGAGPEPRRPRDGRQRPLGLRPRPAPDRGARAWRGLAHGRRARLNRHRREVVVRLRLLDRELEAQPRRGAVPHGFQPRRHPAAGRRDARDGRAGPLGRAPPAAVAVGDQG